MMVAADYAFKLHFWETYLFFVTTEVKIRNLILLVKELLEMSDKSTPLILK